VIASLDEDVVQRVNDLGTTTWSGTMHRYTSTGRDPRSGIWARLFGGRWNPRDVFPTIYLSHPAAACIAELDRTAAASSLPVPMMIRKGLTLHVLAVREMQVLDLREPSALRQVGLGMEDISDEDWTACQAVGHAAYFLDFDGVLAPSATGTGLVLAAFETRLRPEQLTVEQAEPLSENLYQRLHA
jgi:RES domain-containing protein